MPSSACKKKGRKHITLNANGGGFLTASKQFRHGANSKSRINTASNSTKHKSPHLSCCSHITSSTTLYTLSLHDALPISFGCASSARTSATSSSVASFASCGWMPRIANTPSRSEEHTSELQSHHELVCRLLLVKKKVESTSP